MNTSRLPVRHQFVRNEVAAMPIDEVVSTATAFKTLEALLHDSATTGYRPSCYTVPMGTSKAAYVRAEKALRIADAFDAEMAKRGFENRAFRANEVKVAPLTRFARI